MTFAKNSNIGENILRAESIRKFWVVGNSSHVIFEIQGTSFHKNLRNETVQILELGKEIHQIVIKILFKGSGPKNMEIF